MATDSSKKRVKADDRCSPELSGDDIKSLAESLSKDHLVDLLQRAAVRHSDVLQQVVNSTEKNREMRKIFVRGLGTDTKADALREAYSKFGPIQEAVVITDSKTQQGRGYGFVIYSNVDSAQHALKNPNNMVDGRMSICHSAQSTKTPPVTRTKIYISEIPDEITSEKLLDFFSQYGEIAEGPFVFKKGTAQASALIVYKTPEAAAKAVQEPVKTVEGQTFRCKFADGGSKPKVLSDIIKELPAALHPFVLNPLRRPPEGLPLSHIAINSSFLSPELALNNPGLANFSKPSADLPNSGLGPYNPALAALRESLNSTLPGNSLGNSSLSANLLGNSMLAANLYPNLHNNVAQSLAPEASQALPQAIGLSSFGGQAGGLGGYPPQVSAYPHLAGSPLYNVGFGSTSQVGAASSFPSSHLETSLEESLRISQVIGRLKPYYGL